ncbi:methyltransferase type 11 [Xylaria sp. CBS 124048]|nr:methyltransferase type 11 [Xylaria sp. CBS 124048]
METQTYNPARFASYANRSAEKNSAYMLPLLANKTRMHILDVGCGPGSITAGLASRVLGADGSVIGVDANASAIDSARALCVQQGLDNISFLVCDALKLPFADDAFDVVHAHQVLGHLPAATEEESGPVRGLKEMRRVCKPGGFVCAREVEWSSAVVYPYIQGVNESMCLLAKLARHDGKTQAGGRGREFARRAGFRPEDIMASASPVTYANKDDRAWWGENMAARLEASGTLEKGVRLGFVTEEMAAKMTGAWREWAKHEDGFFNLTDGEIICRK